MAIKIRMHFDEVQAKELKSGDFVSLSSANSIKKTLDCLTRLIQTMKGIKQSIPSMNNWFNFD